MRVMTALLTLALCLGSIATGATISSWPRPSTWVAGSSGWRFLWESLATGFDGSVVHAEHMISDVNLGTGRAMVCADLTGDGRMDIIGKPWTEGRIMRLAARRSSSFSRT